MLHQGAWDNGSGLQQLVRPDLIAKCTQWPRFLMNVTDGPGNNTQWLTTDDPPSHFLHTWHGWWMNWSPDWPSSQRAVWPFIPKDAFWMSGYGKDICVVIPSLDMIVAHQTARAGGLEQVLNARPEFFSTLLSKVMAAVVTGTPDERPRVGDPATSANLSAGRKIRIRVAGAQVPVVRDIAKNVETLTRAIEYAAREKADVLITPEGSLSGYTPDFDGAATQQALDQLLPRARAAKLALVLGTCFEAEDGQRYDAQRFYDNEGKYLGFHAKILLCRHVPNPAAKGEIDFFQSRPLRTFNLFGITVGGLVCNDMWANPEWTPMDDPHLSQKLKEMGARVIFLSANTGAGTGESLTLNRSYHETNLRLRARTGKLWIVVANAADPRGTQAGYCPSGVLAPDGQWALTVSPHGEQFFVHTVEVDARVPAVAAVSDQTVAAGQPTAVTNAATDLRPTNVERWDVYEGTLTTSGSYANPFQDVSCTATFTHASSGAQLTVDGFHDGGSAWRFRFMPRQLGTWHWTTASNDGGLDGKTGTIECVAPKKPYLHGPLKAEGYHFVHADGTPRFLISTRLTCQFAPPSTWPPLIAFLKANRINRVLFMMPGVDSKKDPVYTQRNLFTPGPDYTRYHVEAFRAIDEFIDALRQADILASPYFYYDPRREVMWKMTPEQDRAYIRYGMSRLGAFNNVMPVLANEVEIKTTDYKDPAFDLKSHTWANEMGSFLKSRAVFGQPVSVHNPSWHEFAVNPSYFTLLRDWPFAGWTDFMLKQVQMGSIGTAQAMTDDVPQPKTPTYNERTYARRNQLLIDLRRFGQPVIDEEPGYDMGGTASAWNSQTPERMRPTFWTATTAGAYTVWGSLAVYETGDPLPKMKGSVTPRYLRVLHDVMADLPYGQMEPHNESVTPAEVTLDGEAWRTNFALAKPGEAYLVYSLHGGTSTVTLAPGQCSAVRIDPRDGTRKELGAVAGGTVGFSLPQGDWVLIYRRTAHSAGSEFYLDVAAGGRGPTADMSHGSKPICDAGEPRRRVKSPFAGSTNSGSATRLSLSSPAACHSAKVLPLNVTGAPVGFTNNGLAVRLSDKVTPASIRRLNVAAVGVFSFGRIKPFVTIRACTAMTQRLVFWQAFLNSSGFCALRCLLGTLSPTPLAHAANNVAQHPAILEVVISRAQWQMPDGKGVGGSQ